MKRFGWIFLAMGLAIGLRLLVLWLFPQAGNPDRMDAANYNHIARQILQGKGFALYGTPTVFVAPLFPFFLAGVYALFGLHYWIAKAVLILLNGFSVLLVYWLTKALIDEGTGRIAAWVFAVEPSLCGITAFLYTEPLHIPLLLMTMLFLIRGIHKGRFLDFGISAFFMGMATLCKGTTLLFPFFLGSLFILFPAARKLWKQGVFFLLIFGFILVPWTFRNYQRFRVFLPIATGTGESLWTGNYFPFDGEYRYELTRQKAEELTRGLSWIERDKRLGEEGWRMIRSAPDRFLLLFFKKIYRFWIKAYEAIPTGGYRGVNRFIHSVLFLSNLVIVALSLIGIIRFPHKDLAYGALVLLLGYYTLLHAVLFAVPRYRIPLVPLILPFAAFGIRDFLWPILKPRLMPR